MPDTEAPGAQAEPPLEEITAPGWHQTFVVDRRGGPVVEGCSAPRIEVLPRSHLDGTTTTLTYGEQLAEQEAAAQRPWDVTRT
jgi:hypothetical protein